MPEGLFITLQAFLFKKPEMAKILIISPISIGANMTGPAIRYWEFTKQLALKHSIFLAAPTLEISSLLPQLPLTVQLYPSEKKTLEFLAREADAILLQGLVSYHYPFLLKQKAPLIIDLYDPVFLENLEIYTNLKEGETLALHNFSLATQIQQLQHGDFFLCASEKQRDFWLGMLGAFNRLNPVTYQQDKTFRRLIDVVPFGIPSSPPRLSRRVLKGVYKTIGKDDFVVLWGGGLWNWFDPITLIYAMKRICEQRKNIKLFFMGVKYPSLEVSEMKKAREAIELAKSLNLYDRFVFFNDWVPYQERENYLLEADIGISIHTHTIETEFSFRTRILDYIWAGLPIIATRGDLLGSWIENNRLGLLVSPGDIEELKQAILRMVDEPSLREHCKAQLSQIAPQLRWEKIIAPLEHFCERPEKAPDKILRGQLPAYPTLSRPLGYYAKKLLYYYRTGGVQYVVKKIRRLIHARNL
ncbi:MAG TPA: glycosyltransferase family 4 protein [Candidatus Limnocylindrales bacterium]|nr:glycosyltransferase family 4 protein [Candidatus Limnocylindrales bacterium]